MWSQEQLAKASPFSLFAACLIGAEIGQLVIVPVGGFALPSVWPPIGVLAGALILSERRRWGGLVAVACSATVLSTVVLHGQPSLPGLGLAGILGIEAFAAAWLVHRTVDGGFALDRVSHAFVLIVASTVVPIAGGALAAGMLTMADLSPFAAAWRGWWLAEALGMLAMAPLTLTVIAGRSALMSSARSWKGLEIALVLAACVVVALSIFGEALNPLIRVPAYVLPFLLWPVFRFGPGGASAALFIVSFIGMWYAAQGQGPLALAGAAPTNIVIRSQGATAIAAVSFLLLASVVAERKRVAQEHAALVAALQKALAEVKTLRGLIPICAWCHKVRDDAGFWQQIEMYLDARTDATFSHSICPACADKASAEIDSHTAAGAGSSLTS